jgi:hypothetical protein
VIPDSKLFLVKYFSMICIINEVVFFVVAGGINFYGPSCLREIRTQNY